MKKAITTILFIAGFIGLFVFVESTNILTFLLGEGLSISALYIANRRYNETQND